MGMDEMKAVNLGEVMHRVRASGRPNTVLWQAPDSIAFVARGREFRSEFHSDPSDEVMYMIKGDMNLHYRTPDGEEKVAVIREGEIVYCPAGPARPTRRGSRRIRSCSCSSARGDPTSTTASRGSARNAERSSTSV
jgi:uncharacterized RmlC-like cupin family protein